ncbi:MAG: hypothetical protein ACO3B0_09410 [Chitinophagaceae bacterium]
MSIIEHLNSSIPEYETTLPISKQTISFSPFRVKDAKAITTILQEDNKKLALKNMVELLKSYTKESDIEELCLADAEYLFLQVRSKSVDEILNLIYNGKKVQVNINEIKARNEFCEEEIKVGNDITLVLMTPKLKNILRLNSLDKEELIKCCIQKVIVKNEIYKVNKFVTEEIKQVIENLPLSVLPKIEAFLKKQPELYLSLQLEEEQKEVSGILNFFTYR